MTFEQAIKEAQWEVHEEYVQEGIAIGEERGMKKGREEGLEEGMEKGKIVMLLELAKSGLLTLRQAAARAGVTEGEFLRMMEIKG